MALLVAIELVMKLVGLGSVPVGPLYMSFLTASPWAPSGPARGCPAGRRIRRCRGFYDAITGASAMTGALFPVGPLNLYPVRGYACAHGSVLWPDLQGPAKAG